MIFHTFGNTESKVIMLIHGMLTPRQIWEDAVSVLAKEYYVVVPELDAHTEDRPSSFLSAENEAEQIRDYIMQDFGGKLG